MSRSSSQCLLHNKAGMQGPTETVEAVREGVVAVNAPPGICTHQWWKLRHQEAKRFNKVDKTMAWTQAVLPHQQWIMDLMAPTGGFNRAREVSHTKWRKVQRPWTEL